MSRPDGPLPPDVLRPYTGGHTVVVSSYRYELCPAHPAANPWGFVPQHRLAAERKIGRYLREGEVVHHDDETKLNNDPSNLEVMTRGAHMALHRHRRKERTHGRLARNQAQQALQEGGLHHAARALGVSKQTLHNRFPDLTAPLRRRSPADLDDPALIAQLRRLGPDPAFGFREVTARTGAAFRTIQHACRRHGIPWVRKSKAGEVHRQYRRKSASHRA